MKKRLPNLLIVEGLWQVGKTKLAGYFSRNRGYVKIEEPNHLDYDVIKNIDKWYVGEHRKRMDQAKDYLRNKRKVVMERSMLSSLAYFYAKNKKLPNNLGKELDRLREVDDFVVVFLFSKYSFFVKNLKNIKDEEVKNNFISDKSFYNRYVFFYKNILKKFIGNKLIVLDVENNNNFASLSKTISKIICQIPVHKKIKYVCSGIIAYHKKNVLLLYDHKYKHYVLPQGKNNKGESMKEAALRELEEETGFYDCRIIKKVKQYQYHYFLNNQVIFKQINVYLVKMTSLQKKKKRLEKHENYSNKFFKFNEAVNKARWRIDKEVILSVRKYIKNNPLS